MTLQLASDNWELKFNNTLSSQSESHYLGTFTSPYVIAYVESSFALPEWSKGGFIGQSIETSEGIAYGKRQELLLDESLLLQFPILSGTSYQLYYFPLARLNEVHLTVREYKGSIIDTATQSLLEALQGQIEVTTNLPANYLTDLQLLSELTNLIMGLFAEQLSTLLASTAATTTTATITTTIALIVPANSNRKGLTIKNNGPRGAAINFSNTMDVPNGNYYVLIPANATYDFPVNYTGEIYAVIATATGTTPFRITEFT